MDVLLTPYGHGVNELEADGHQSLDVLRRDVHTPKGTTVIVPSWRLHLDNERHDNEYVLILSAFLTCMTEDVEGSQFVSTSMEDCHSGMLGTPGMNLR